MEERIASPFGRVPHGPVPAEEKQNAARHVPGQLNENLRGDPSGPTVHLARSFPDLIDCPARDERDLQLLSARDGQDEDDEDREQLILNTLQGTRALPESETDEETAKDVQYKFGCDVGRVAPDGSRAASRHNNSLVNPRSRVFVMQRRFDGRSVPSLVVNSLDLLCGGGGLGRSLPNSMPVGSRSGSGTSPDDIEHEFSPITPINTR